jgi:hypothetical protein
MGYILRRNCILNSVLEGKIEVRRRRRKRQKQLPDDLTETMRSWKLQAEILDRTPLRTRFRKWQCTCRATEYVLLLLMMMVMIVPRSKCLWYFRMSFTRPHSEVLSQRIITVYEEIIMALRQQRQHYVLSLGTSPVLVAFRSTASDMTYTSW